MTHRFTTSSLSWLRCARAACGIALALLAACGGGDDGGGTAAPQIVTSPGDRQAIVGQVSSFFVEGQGAGLAFGWEEQPGGSGDWRASTGSVTSDGFVSNLFVGPVDIGMDKTRFRGRVDSNAGSVISAEARINVVWGTVSTLEPDPFVYGPGAEGLSGVDGGTPGGGDGEGAGVGGGLGKTPGATITVTRAADGTVLGSAPAGATSGTVRVKAGPGAAPVVITLTGGPGATYYDEGQQRLLPLAADQQLHALVLSFDRHLGVSTLTEAAYLYALNHFLQDPAAVRAGTLPLKRTATAEEIARLTPAQIQLANEAIRNEINKVLPPRYALESISTLPVPVDNASASGAVADNIYGRMQVVVGGLSLAAARFAPSLANPALTINAQLASDLTDGVVDGQSLDQGSVFGTPGSNAYSPVSLPQSLAEAADEQFRNLGDDTIPPLPVINIQPSAATITQGGTGTVRVDATGSLLTYQWYLDGSAVAGATRPELTTALGGEYFVEVANAGGTVTSTRVTVTVVAAPVAPTIDVQPVLTTVTSGDSAAFTVQASGTNLRYQWQLVSAPNTANDIPGAVSSSYATTTAGTYRVVVSNDVRAVTSQDAILTVAPRILAPRITRQPSSQVALGAQAVTLQVEASGNPLAFQWHNDSGPIANASASSFTTAIAGTYHVVVSNSAGSVTSNPATVNIRVAPTITTQPASATFVDGRSHTFSVAASGSDLVYQWADAGGPIVNANAASLTTGTAGTYWVVVSNGAGAVQSAIATLTMTPKATTPAITSHPSSATINVGTSATLGVTATGPSLTYQWFDDAGAIASANASSHTTGAAGTYYVVVRSIEGEVTSNRATVTVQPPLAFTLQPAPATIVAGDRHTFSVVASGSNLLYQWYEATWGPIPNANAASFTTDIAGGYFVVVSNRLTSVTSAIATLTVTPRPAASSGVTLQPRSATTTPQVPARR